MNFRDQRRDDDMIKAMPKSFGTIKEAEIYLTAITRRILYWLGNLPKLQPNHDAKLGTLEGVQISAAASYSEVQKKAIDEVSNWNHAFKHLWALAPLPTHKDFRDTMYLRVNYIIANLVSRTVGIPLDTINPKCDPALEEVISISRAVVLSLEIPKQDGRYDRGSEQMLWDVPTVTQLMTVGMRFRNRRLRKEAVELLVCWPRQERAWNSRKVGLLIEWLHRLEDVGLGDDILYIPNKCALRNVQMENDPLGRTTKVSCEQPTAQGWVMKKMVASWDDLLPEDIGAEDSSVVLEETHSLFLSTLYY